MRMRQFTASTTGEALRELRATLGEEALVLSTHSEPGCVIITAAVDEEPAERDLTSLLAPASASTDDGGDELRSDVALIRAQLEQLGRKVHRMDRVLLELDGGASALGPDAREIAGRLMSGGFARHLAQPVAQSFEREVAGARSHADALRASLLEHVVVASDAAPRIEALVGPTGSGKTTTIAKLLARAVVAGERPPGLIAADNVRIAAVEELSSYARLFGASLRIARDPAEMRAAVHELAGCERILIDTAGLCGDASSCAEVHALLAAAGAAVGVTAVVSATASLSSLQRAWPQLARLAPGRAIVTRLDECDEPGTAATWLAEVALPLAWLATGRRVPDDLVAARGADLVRWLIAA
jgi:flagellar biosynthesis protein FlhF